MLYIGPDANGKEFYNYFFGFSEEEKSVKNPEIYHSYKEQLENEEVKAETFLFSGLFSGAFYKPPNALINESEQPELFMKWISKDKDRRDFISRKYSSSDRERKFFRKLLFQILGSLRLGQI